MQSIENSCLSAISNFKVKKNLGREQVFVGNFSAAGYEIHYIGGDECEAGAEGELYSSEIRYVCNNETD